MPEKCQKPVSFIVTGYVDPVTFGGVLQLAKENFLFHGA